MNSETDDPLMSEALASTLGRIDALTAAAFGILELSKNIPEVSMAIKENMAEQSAKRSPDFEGPQYLQAFGRHSRSDSESSSLGKKRRRFTPLP